VVTVPTTVPAAIVLAVFNWSTAVFTVLTSVAISIITGANAKSKSLGASNGRGRYRKSGRKNKSKFPH
jgi:hypothetical protein